MTLEYVAERRRSFATSAKPDVQNSLTEVTAEARRLMDDLFRGLDRDLDGARLAAGRLAELLCRSAEQPPARGGLAPWQAKKVRRFMADQLDQTIRIADLADQAGLSVSHFCRAFRESFGETPHACVMRLRLERAQELMLTTSEPLSHVALACGLADQAHLSKLFRRCIGQTPSAWRRRHMSGAQPPPHSRTMGEPGARA